MNYKYASFFKYIIVVSDYLILNLTLFIGYLMENPATSLLSKEAEYFRLNFLVLNLFWFLCSTVVRLYDNIIKKDAIPTISATLAAMTMYFIAPFAMTFAIPNFNQSTKFVILSFVLFFLLICVSRLIFLAVRKKQRRFWIEYKSVVIIGAGKVGKEIYNYFHANPHLGLVVAGYFDDNFAPDMQNSKLALGKIDDCMEYVKNNGVSEIFCALPGNDLDQVRQLMREADKNLIRFKLVPDLKAFFNKNVMLEFYDQLPVLSLRKEPLENKANEVIKRTFDVAFSLLVIIFILSWLIPLMALLIKLDSRGPVFFKQMRSGKDNKPFSCYKFRSMKVNGESDSVQATKGDKRITKVGSFLRKTSIDEIPQFFNVLRGDMSIVGPRPHMLKHTQDYSNLIESFMARHFVTPGITGWAQVIGYRGETKEIEDMTKRVEADLWYLENWSLLLDLKIIFLTIWQFIHVSEKAY